MNKVIKTLNKNVRDSEENIQIYLSEIKQKTNKEEYDSFIKNLNNVDNIIQLNNDIQPEIKTLVYNVIKGFMIHQKRIEVGDSISIQLAKLGEKYKNDLAVLKNHISNLTQIMEENRLDIPEIKPICLETTVSTQSSIDKRLELLRLAAEKDGDINDFIKNLQKGKSGIISNEALKKAAKDNNINIRMCKNEVNRVIKN